MKKIIEREALERYGRERFVAGVGDWKGEDGRRNESRGVDSQDQDRRWGRV